MDALDLARAIITCGADGDKLGPQTAAFEEKVFKRANEYALGRVRSGVQSFMLGFRLELIFDARRFDRNSKS